MSSKKGKRLILVRNDLLKEIIKITAREGKTVFAFTNEVFEQAVKAYEMQTSPAELLEFFSLMKTEKDTGAVMIQSDLLSYIIKKLYGTDKEDLLKKWYDSGLWYGKYLAVQFHDQDPIEIFQKLMKTCIWNITDFSIRPKGENVNVRCISPHLTPENTELLSRFLEGVLHSLNYKTLKNECMKGMILLDLKKTE